MITDFLIVFAGIAVVLLLSEVVVRNAIDLAHFFHLSGAFIGLTILSIGTSIPELMAHVVGSVTILRQPDSMDAISGLLIGTNIGSDIFQQNFVLPLVGLIGTVLVVREDLVPELGALVGAAVLVWVFCLGGNVSRVEGTMLVVAYGAYLVFLGRDKLLVEQFAPNSPRSRRRIVMAGTLIILCFSITAIVTERVVVAATEMLERVLLSSKHLVVITVVLALVAAVAL